MRGIPEVCATFNRAGVRYMIMGAQACALHGHIRATEDIDILIEATPENLDRTISALQELFPDFPEPFSAEDILEHTVLKIADDIELDVSTSAWSVPFSEAITDCCEREIEGVLVPYMGLQSLIRSKLTQREIDQWDVRVLQEIARRKNPSPQ